LCIGYLHHPRSLLSCCRVQACGVSRLRVFNLVCETIDKSSNCPGYHLDQSPKMSNRVKRDVRLEVAPGALGVTFEADYNGCAGKFFQHTHQMHDKNDLRFFNCVTLPLLLTQFYFLLQCIQPSSNDL
jgi:hypothetical protein